ncbi:MAG: cisplatin damage response ATP-dependent DNA ligase [Hyphomicrobiaceae bacterium]|nr:cisplatin damage response ATP-dependent DNA ligase [Hyphomicrobiaceae bacterium]
MKAFAALLDRLAYSPGRNTKLQLMQDYFRSTPDPDRGWALAALTDGLPFTFPVRRTIMELMDKRLDAELFRLSRDYVGDTAETVALVWPDTAEQTDPPRLSEVVSRLGLIDAQELGDVIAAWLDRLDATGRWALLKLLTGALRVGVSARLAKTAIAAMAGHRVDDVEEVWHALSPPYEALFAWLEGRAAKPDITGAPVFRPLMLAHALEESELAALDISEFAAEWKWDGIRVQIAAGCGEARLYSRTGDDIGASFPELVSMFRFDAVVDGELLVVRDGKVAPFNDLQQRLNRKTVTRAMMDRHPAHVRLYDALVIGGDDLRPLPFIERRARLEQWHVATRPAHTDLSELVGIADRAELERIWRETRGASIEGLMLKRRASPYLAGRPRGHWYKWKRAPITLDCVLMYAQRGSGRRSSYYSDYTFGAWTQGPGGSEALVPVGKAYSGYTDAELIELDRWVRNNTVERFGPVRSVRPGLVLEVAFDSVQRSVRHRSGVAMRFPRIHRIRWDKPAAEAERLQTLVGLIDA